MEKRPTNLSEFVYTFRKSKNLSQAAFQKLLETRIEGKSLGAKYVSLIETGERRVPSSLFLEAFHQLSGYDQSDLVAMSKRETGGSPDSTRPNFVRIVCGHTLSASALIATALEGNGKFSVASCAAKDGEKAFVPNGANANWITGWHEGGVSDEHSLLKKIHNSEDTFYFSANQAFKALENGWADIIAVPAKLASEYDYVKLGRLVASANACTLIVTDRLFNRIFNNQNDLAAKLFTSGGELSTRQLASIFASSGTGDKVVVGAEPDTMGEDIFMEMKEFAACDFNGKPAFLSDNPIPIASQKASDELTTLDCLRRDAKLDHEASLDAILLWEPHASWIVEKLKPAKDGLKAVSVLHSSEPKNNRPRRFDFDLFTTGANANNKRIIEAVIDLQDRARYISKGLSLYPKGRHRSLVEPLAVYFRLSDPKVLESTTTDQNEHRYAKYFGSIGYDVQISINTILAYTNLNKGE